MRYSLGKIRRVRLLYKVVASCLAVLLVGGSFAYLKFHSRNPLPSDIKPQVNYKVVFPDHTSLIDQNSYKFNSEQGILTFKVQWGDKTVVFSEQPAPSSLGSDTNAYYPALGIHPYAQFKTKLGQVALTKFWQSGNFKPIGQSAVLASNGTLVVAHSDKDLSNNEWKELFESLAITK